MDAAHRMWGDKDPNLIMEYSVGDACPILFKWSVSSTCACGPAHHCQYVPCLQPIYATALPQSSSSNPRRLHSHSEKRYACALYAAVQKCIKPGRSSRSGGSVGSRANW